MIHVSNTFWRRLALVIVSAIVALSGKNAVDGVLDLRDQVESLRDIG
jgi:hypothetical protein